MTTLSILSANVLGQTAQHSYGSWSWPRRAQRAVRLLLRDGADVLALQECEPDQRVRIVVDSGASSWRVHGNLVVLTRGDWRIVDDRVLPIGGQDALACRVEHDGTGAALWVVCVHLKTEQGERARQVVALVSAVAALTGPVVVCGDCNQPSLVLPGFSDVRKASPDVTGGGQASFVGRSRVQQRTGRWLDHILTRGLTVGAVRLVTTRGASDHNWPSVRLTIPEAGVQA